MCKESKDTYRLIAASVDDSIIEFLRSHGFRPKRTKKYFVNLQKRLKRKGLRLTVERHWSPIQIDGNSLAIKQDARLFISIEKED